MNHTLIGYLGFMVITGVIGTVGGYFVMKEQKKNH
jgi:hypothetical protein